MANGKYPAFALRPVHDSPVDARVGRGDRGIEAAPHRHRHKIPHVAAMIVTYVFATYELAINESSLRHIMIFH
ncbi:hypothetical protein DXA22_08455 [Bifidobacterium pseudocatenulatum]|uniref:Uncharacterized protein n=1 Tax=Bifidobacterium pseudocatenulatum TaxID=28026 RepID=A0A413KB96_BIFPS|nr:hypothetical protein DXA22_08455 [Bifidobacterium pseudocatenulatum]RHB78376.1 hypothetical protein DW872_09020 [Bifidobacterium pseudocatenulatum]